MEDSLSQGLSLMLLGMGMVFGFLILLILSMKVVSGIITRFFPEKEEENKIALRAGGSDVEIAIAIAAAQNYSK